MVSYQNGGNISPSGTIVFAKSYAVNFKPTVILTPTRHSLGDGYIGGVSQDSVTNTQFSIRVDAFNTGVGRNNTQQIYWIAIGKG